MASFPSMMASLMLVCVFCCDLRSCVGTSISYEDYCNAVLKDAAKERPQQDVPSTSRASDFRLGFHRAFFSGGSPLFNSNFTTFSLRRPRHSAYFSTLSVKLLGEQETQKYAVEGTLLLLNRTGFWPMSNITRVFRQAGVKRGRFAGLGGMRLTLKGLWVARSGTLCMSGCFMQDVLGQTKPRDDCQLKAVFYYPEKNSITQPLVKGVIESKREQQDPLYFKPVYITGAYDASYVFKNDIENVENWPSQQPNVPESVKIWRDEGAVCQFPWYKQALNVMWDKQCTGQDCSPFENVILGSPTPLSFEKASYLSVEKMVCKDAKVYGFFIFNNQATSFQTVYNVFAVEGIWNTSAGQLSAYACHLKGAANGSLTYDSQDCDIQITLQFPTTLSLLFRYSVVGRVERKKASRFPSFKPFSFTGRMDITYGSFGWGSSPPQMEYAYTGERITQARTQCKANGSVRSKKGWLRKGKPKYPNGQIFEDFGFQATLKDSSGSSAEVYFSLVSIDKRTNVFFTRSIGVGVVTSAATSKPKTKSMNVSFDLNFYSNNKGIKLLQNTSSFSRFPAEGVYNRKTGMLCLIACRPLTLSKAQVGSKLYDDKDCDMLVTIQYPPINPGYFEKHGASGKVTSLREQKDSLYFSPATVSSASFFYQEQAANSLLQIDFEIIMGIISLTMAVLFIGLQLQYVKKNPKVLSQMSLLMLTVLTLGHLIPLVLNFEAIFSSRSRQNVLQWSGGWLEINEVIVRLMTMLVFLMLIRLFYLSWVSKTEVSSSEGPWHMERGSLRVCLTLYALGGLLALIVGIKASSFLDITKAFAGLTVDFFLFPQVVGNYVWELQGTVLSWPFYVGMTLVRSLPHLYDILRKLEFFSLGNRRYYYANPSWDFYSKAWDAIIPFGNVLLAVLIALQQRYGGVCLSIGSWRKSRSYVQVSMNPI